MFLPNIPSLHGQCKGFGVGLEVRGELSDFIQESLSKTGRSVTLFQLPVRVTKEQQKPVFLLVVVVLFFLVENETVSTIEKEKGEANIGGEERSQRAVPAGKGPFHRLYVDKG